MAKSVEEAKAALDTANATYLRALQLDSERGEGSVSQERRREERLQSLSEEVARCERNLQIAERAK